MSDPIMKRSRGSSPDLISNLPNNVIEHILACLPTRDAIRTSILSTEWKYKWVTLPHLVFNDNTFTGASIKPQAAVMTDFVEVDRVISQVLLQHSGLVHKFVLSISHLRSCPGINHWLSFLSRNGIEDLILEIQTPKSHAMPSNFFSCEHLRHLTLSNCIVRPPPNFSGFKKLRRVKFERVQCPATSLENLITNSPFLEKLTLTSCKMLDFQSLAINAPNLVCLLFTGDPEALCSINAPRLLKLGLGCFPRSGLSNHVERNRSFNMFNLLGCLPGTIERLALNTNTSQSMFLETGNVLKNLPDTFSHLWIIHLMKFSFENLDSVACALCLIRNAPNLKDIRMHITTSIIPPADDKLVLPLMKANLDLSVNLKKLVYLRITSLGGTTPEMEFIKFVLASSPLLREVTITADRAHPSYNGSRTRKELVSFSRASSASKIIYSDED